MQYVGAHVSAAGGVHNAPLNARRIGADAFAFFTRNQRRWRAAPLTEEEVAAFRANCRSCGYGPSQILPHDSYLINLGHPDPEGLARSRAAFLEELERCAQLGIAMLNLHPGAHLGRSSEADCLARIAESLDEALSRVPGVTAVVENTAGQGTSVGYRFEHLATLLERVEQRERVGVCLDTCHLYAAGYDLRTWEACEATFSEFDRIVGFAALRAFHLNGSKARFGSRVDRHHSLHAGELGCTVFEYLMGDPRFDGLPMILETIDPARWPEEIAWLKSLAAARAARRTQVRSR